MWGSEPDMDTLALQQTLTNQLRQIARTCLHLHLEPGKHSPSEAESGFGGQPWWPAGEPWPGCDSCGEPLGFLCQLRLDGGGHWRPDHYDLLSVFFCWQCNQRDDSAGDERPSGDRCRLRLLRLHAQPLAPLTPPANLSAQGRLVPSRVQGTPALDVPSWQDVAEELAEIAPHALDDLHISYHLAVAEVLQREAGAAYHQLGGYPHWISTSTWPECRWCGGQMYLLAQFVEEERIGLDWGNIQRVYLFCCAEPCDPEALTLVLES